MTIDEKVKIYTDALSDVIKANTGEELTEFDKQQMDIVATNYALWLRAQEQLAKYEDLACREVAVLLRVTVQAEQRIDKIVGQYALGSYNRAKLAALRAKAKCYEATAQPSLFDDILTNDNENEENGKEFNIVSHIIRTGDSE